MACVPVLAVLRRVSDSDSFSESRLLRVAECLKANGLPTSRELRLGFPETDEGRREETRGLASEVAKAILGENADETHFLLYAAVDTCADLPRETCHSRLATGGGVRDRRLLQGTFVDGESAAAHVRRLVAPGVRVAAPIAALPKGRLSFGVAAAPHGFESTASRKTVAAVASSLTTLAPKRARVECEEAAPTLGARENAKLLQAQGAVLELPSRVGPLSAVWRELCSEDPDRDLGGSETEVLLNLIMGKTQPKATLDYCEEVNGYLSWLAGIGRPPANAGPLVVCSFLRLTLSRGKSVPAKVKCRLSRIFSSMVSWPQL